MEQFFAYLFWIVTDRFFARTPRPLRWIVLLFGFFATLFILIIFTVLTHFVSVSDERIAWLWGIYLVASPLIVIGLASVFSVLDTPRRATGVQLLQFAAVCAVPIMVLLAVFTSLRENGP